MKSVRIKRSLFKIHSWLGLGTGIFLILLGLSGSILVFRTELDSFLNQDLLRVTPLQNGLPTDALTRCYNSIVDRYPNLDGIAWLNPDALPTEAYDFRIYFNDTRLMTYDLALITFDPYSGTILREGAASSFTPSLIEWLFQFHFSFQLGMPGAALTAVFGITMLLSLLTGIVVYKKMIWKVITFQIRINRKNWRTISSDLHRIVGVWSLLLNAVIFFTGFWMNLFAFKAKTWQNEMIATKPNTVMSVAADQLYSKARQLAPDLEPTYVYLPTQPVRKFEVRGYEKGQWKLWGIGDAIRIDQQTGELVQVVKLSEKSLGERIEATFLPLHIGNYGGVIVKIIYVVIGLTPGLLAITGFLLWWRRTWGRSKGFRIVK